jgi:tol-pal system protein YbgF
MSNMRRTRSSTAARAFLAMAAVSTLGGCAMKSDVRDLQTEIRTLAIRQDSLITELRMATASTQDTLRTQSGQLFDFRGDVLRLLREVREELTQMRALTGENQRGIVQLREMVARSGGVPGGGGAVTTPSGGGGMEGMPGMSGGGGADAQQLWEAATQQLARGSLTTAQRAFRQFLEEYPNHDRAPDAYFFLADILVQQGENEEALSAFGEVQQRFPSSTRVPDALYRMALLHIEAGDVDEARTLLQRIVNTYPETAIALIARDKLEEIG